MSQIKQKRNLKHNHFAFTFRIPTLLQAFAQLLNVGFALSVLLRFRSVAGLQRRRDVLVDVGQHQLPVAVDHDADDGHGKQQSGDDFVVVLQVIVVVFDTDEGPEEATQAKVSDYGQGLADGGDLAREDVTEVQDQGDPG
uniref:(northern house mosquito) hypothetical protein n=1 Tax=Culex pipiens TaxID=7175 RepID=A0A8D8CQ06_CULPI